MTDVADARAIIQEEEVDFRSPLSEAVLTKVAGTNNFISNRQHLVYQFNVNGNYNRAISAIEAIDGFIPILFDIEITGIFVYGQVNGGTGSTDFDIHRFTDSATDAGSIFSTPPSIAPAASNNAYLIRDLINSVDYGDITNFTLPVFSTTQLDAGDALRCDLDAAMTAGESAGVHILYRPR